MISSTNSHLRSLNSVRKSVKVTKVCTAAVT